jgi:hypothetical protein
MEADMEDDNDYWDHQRPNLQKTVCAWAIVFALAFIFTTVELVWPSQPAPIGLAAVDGDVAVRARRAFDREKVEDVEPVVNGSGADEIDPRQIALER